MAAQEPEWEDEPAPPKPVHALAGERLSGEVVSWHFVDRRGAVKATNTRTNEPEEFPILAAGAFETLMPTAHRDLAGAKATFVVGTHGEATHIVLDLKSLKTAEATTQAKEATAPPSYGKRDLRKDTLRVKAYAEQRAEEEEKKRKRAEERAKGSVTVIGATARVVCPATMSGIVISWSRLYRTGMIAVPRGEDETPLHYVVQSTNDFVDAMPSSLELRGAVVEFRPVHTHLIANVSEVQAAQEELHRAVDRQRRSQADRANTPLPPEHDPLVEVLGDAAAGQSARVTVGPSPVPEPASAEELGKLAPKDMNVKLGRCTNMIAEDIVIKEFPKPLSEEEIAQADEVAPGGIRGSFVSARDADDQELPLDEPGPHYGVVTRWSGGTGTLESATGRVFFIEGVQSFASFDPNQAAIRGAVVQFVQNPDKMRFAQGIVILSEVSASGGVGDSSSLPQQQLPLSVIHVPEAHRKLLEQADYSEAIDDAEAAASSNDAAAGQNASSGSTSAAPSEEPSGSDDDPFAHLPTKTGTLVTYSAKEHTGVIEEDDTGTRLVVRDAQRDVVGFKAAGIQKAFEKGCSVTFVAVGVSGRIATRVRIVKTKRGDDFDADKAAEERPKAAAEEDEDAGADGAEAADGKSSEPKSTDEATASPMATEYWLRRFERVGANMTEYRKMTEGAIKPPEEDEHLDDYMKGDPWFEDPKRNKKVRGEATVSDMMKVSPMNLVSLAMRGRQDPAKLEADKKKMEKRVPPQMQMQCREDAKQIAPKFLKQVQDAQNRGKEWQFTYF